MGDIIDTKEVDKNLRCKDVKFAVVIINIVGVPVSFLLLAICVVRMISSKKNLSFATYIILFIFFCEIMNDISKMLQVLKYNYEDTRRIDQNNSFETPRGIICQIQIVFSIFSDFGCLLGTLLLSIRTNGLIKNKKRFFDSRITRFLSIFLIILFSIISALIFLFIDRKITHDVYGFKYDIRDRCNYWCWLEHRLSTICYGFYFLFLVFNIIIACKNYYFLKKSYNKLMTECAPLLTKSNTPDFLKVNKDKDNIYSEGKINKTKDMSSLDQERIVKIEIMKLKFLIYPFVTIIIWTLSTLYRVIDDSIMYDVDMVYDNKESNKEEELFNDNYGLQTFVEIILVFHTVLSAFRGIFYAFSFIIFEEKLFGNFFRRIYYKCFCKTEDFDNLENNENEITPINNSLAVLSMAESTGSENNEGKADFRKSSASEYEKNSNDLNTSDYRDND